MADPSLRRLSIRHLRRIAAIAEHGPLPLPGEAPAPAQPAAARGDTASLLATLAMRQGSDAAGPVSPEMAGLLAHGDAERRAAALPLAGGIVVPPRARPGGRGRRPSPAAQPCRDLVRARLPGDRA